MYYAILEILLYFLVLGILTKPLGTYIAKIYSDEPCFAPKVLGGIERGLYRLAGVKEKTEMDWKEYAFAVIIFSMIGFLVLYFILTFQSHLPLNPKKFGDFSSDLAFNVAASYITNTNWQSFSPEISTSYFSQLIGLMVQNFISPSVGIAVLIALIRGIARKNSLTIGNFWKDMLRANLYILLPLSIIFSIIFLSQGVVQSFNHNLNIPKLENSSMSQEHYEISLAPLASQVAIKLLGSNGGGYYNTNSAHPFDNPTPYSNFMGIIAILLIPTALCYTFGRMVGDTRQGWVLLAVNIIVLLPLLFFAIYQEQHANKFFDYLQLEQGVIPNMEGKEQRFGVAGSVIWTVVATATSNGAINSGLDSFTPLGAFIPLVLMQLGEVIFGGVGSGLYSMLMYVIITVFIAGLMIGRTPEYLGKKIQAFEIKMTSITLLIPGTLLLLGSGFSLRYIGINSFQNPPLAGFIEVIYAFTSTSNNNGSGMGALNTNTVFFNTIFGVIMLFSRFWIIIPVLAIAGSLANKGIVPTTLSTLPTHNLLFILFVIAIIIIMGLLSFFPALALGPIVEHLNWGRI